MVLASLGEVVAEIGVLVKIILICSGTVEVSLICLLNLLQMEWCPLSIDLAGMAMVSVSPLLEKPLESRAWREMFGRGLLMVKASLRFP